MLNKFELVRLHRLAYSYGKQFYNSKTEEDKKFYKDLFEKQENLLLDQFDFRWYYTSKDWFPSYKDVNKNRILNSDGSITLDCFIVLKKNKKLISCKMTIKSDDTLSIFNDIEGNYNLKDVIAYYIIPKYIQEN